VNIDRMYDELKKRVSGDNLKLNEPMNMHTSFKIGGPADIMVLPGNIEGIVGAVEVCRGNNCPYFIMGNGTNLLVRDGGYRGVIIKIGSNMSGYSIDGHEVYGQAGILLSTLSVYVAQASLEGMEFASGIPGTLGGAIAMNAGAYDGEMKNIVEWARVVTPYGDVKKLSVEEMEMGYRTSVVQREGLIVVDCGMRLKKGNREKIERPPGYYAGKLVEEAGLKGKRIGNAQVSDIHCGFVVNLGGANAGDVITLINYIRKEVKNKFGVELEPEVKIIGED